MVTRVEPGCGGFVVAQPGAGGGVVEDLDDLGAEAAGELPVPAERVLAGDPALLVRGGAERQVGLAEQAVVGDDAVARRVDVRQAGPHAPVHRDRAPDAKRRAGCGGQAGVGADAGDDQDHVRQRVNGLAAGGGGLDTQPAASPALARLICLTVVPVRTSTPWAASSAWTSAPSSGSTVGRTSGSCSIWVTDSPRAVSASAISRPM